MSQKTDLQSNNVDLQTILNTINNLPEAGSGGGSGSSINTCNLTIEVEEYRGVTASIAWISWTALENGNITAKKVGDFGDLTIRQSIDLYNLVCGSAITFYNTVDYVFKAYISTDNTLSVLHTGGGYFILKAPTTPNVSATVHFYDDD